MGVVAPRQIEVFELAERLLERGRQHSAGTTKESLLEVGRALEEVLITLAQHLYRPTKHEPRHGPKPGASAKRRLDAYIDVELTGPRNEPSRSLAKSSLETADSLLQIGTEDVRTAAVCLQAVTSLVNVLRITTGPQQPVDLTIRELIATYLKARPELGETHRLILMRAADMDIGQKRVSELTAEDVIKHCEVRRRTTKASTVNQDILFLRGVLTMARDVWTMDISLEAFDEAKRWLEKRDVIGKAERRTRRPTADELDRLLDHFEKQDRNPRTRIPMRDFTLFALYSGIRRGAISELKWNDLDEGAHTCKVPGFREPLQIAPPAWAIIEKQRSRRVDDRIFPYDGKSVGKRYIDAKHYLGIKGLRFQDLRREAAIRLHYEHKLTIEQVAKSIGRTDLNTLRRDILEAAGDYKPEGVVTNTS